MRQLLNFDEMKKLLLAVKDFPWNSSFYGSWRMVSPSKTCSP
jgi:hypothetical protein